MQHQQHALAFMLSREKAEAMPAGGMLADDQVCHFLSTMCSPHILPNQPCMAMAVSRIDDVSFLQPQTFCRPPEVLASTLQDHASSHSYHIATMEPCKAAQ